VGEFSRGRKSGWGVKTWFNGDRYEGQWLNDRRHGKGAYSWGPKSKWAGERYSGDYVQDQMHGFGIYEWPNGEVYRGRWDKSVMLDPAPPMFVRRLAATREILAAVQKVGQRVCRDYPIGIAGRGTIKGRVEAAQSDKVSVRVEVGDDEVSGLGTGRKKGDLVWDDAIAWYPCY
jgi:hypothetical protein